MPGKRVRYAVLADRLTLVRASNPDTDSGGGIRPVGVLLYGVAAAFTADDIEALIVTADAVSTATRTRSPRGNAHLAARAHQLLADLAED